MKRILTALLLLIPGTAQAQAQAQAPAAPPLSARPGDAALIQNCDGLFTLAKTYALARNWINAWNSTSVDRVMALYTRDFEFRARGILPSNRKSSPDGVLHGQADNRLRWFDPAAGGTKGPGTFRLVDAYAGVRSIAVHYLNGSSEPVVEVMEFAPNCKIERSNALYGPMPIGVPSTWDEYPTTPDGIVVAKPTAPR